MKEFFKIIFRVMKTKCPNPDCEDGRLNDIDIHVNCLTLGKTIYECDRCNKRFI